MDSTRRFGPLLLLLGLLLCNPVAHAQESGSAEVADRLGRSEVEVSEASLRLNGEFMSPYCPGATLRDCTSGKAQDLRERIKDWLREGRSESWIRAQMVEEFGEQVLGSPPFNGSAILVWVLPIVGLLAGLGLVLHYSKLRSPRPATGPLTTAPVGADASRVARIEREIRARLG